MTDEDFAHALDALRLTSRKAPPAQSKSTASRWTGWLWIVVAIIVVFGVLPFGVLAVIAMGLMASA